MGRNSLQYTVLIVGTIAFALILFFMVEVEKGKMSFLFDHNTSDYNQLTTEVATIYAKPDNNSSVIITVSADTQVKTTSETKYYFKVTKVEGNKKITDGYISKKQLKKL